MACWSASSTQPCCRSCVRPSPRWLKTEASSFAQLGLQAERLAQGQQFFSLLAIHQYELAVVGIAFAKTDQTIFVVMSQQLAVYPLRSEVHTSELQSLMRISY